MFHSTLIVLSIWLMRITTTSLKGVNCVLVENSKSSWLVMHSERAISCYSGDHIPGALVAWLVMLTYCFTFPVVTFVLLRREVCRQTGHPEDDSKVAACMPALTSSAAPI